MVEIPPVPDNPPRIDFTRWPGLEHKMDAPLLTPRASRLRYRLEQLLDSHNISTSSGDSPFFLMHDGVVLDRLVTAGFLGLAEGYMAGEWDADPLPEVLRFLLTQPLEDRWGRMISHRQSPPDFGGVRSGELSDTLVSLYAGDTHAVGSALFHSGTRTTQTESRPSFRAHAGKEFRGKVIPSHRPVDVTWLDAPRSVDRRDLDAAQRHRIEMMLDTAKVGPGDRVLELPSSGGELAIAAAVRGAHVDILATDRPHADFIAERAREAGVSGAIRVELLRGSLPSPRQWSGSYDAIFSVERMETMGREGAVHFLKTIDRMLSSRGIAVIQTVTSTQEKLRPEVEQALYGIRAYIWPTLDFYGSGFFQETVDRHTSMRLTQEFHVGSHYEHTLSIWRANFLSRQRQAAAQGIDTVYRRLWDYNLSLHQALVMGGDIDCVLYVLEPSTL